MATKFRKPKEMKAAEKRVPVSLRVRESLRGDLSRAAKLAGLTIAELIENVLEDYAKFLRND